MNTMTVGIDLAKNVFHVVDLNGRRKRLSRTQMSRHFANTPSCTIAMEACGGAHHVARHCQVLGHEVRLMSPLYVQPYVKVHKTDDRGAEAIAEAAMRLNALCSRSWRKVRST